MLPVLLPGIYCRETEDQAVTDHFKVGTYILRVIKNPVLKNGLKLD